MLSDGIVLDLYDYQQMILFESCPTVQPRETWPIVHFNSALRVDRAIFCEILRRRLCQTRASFWPRFPLSFRRSTYFIIAATRRRTSLWTPLSTNQPSYSLLKSGGLLRRTLLPAVRRGCYQWTLNGPERYPESVSIFDLTLYGSFIPTVSASYGTFNDASMSHMARSGDEAW